MHALRGNILLKLSCILSNKRKKKEKNPIGIKVEVMMKNKGNNRGRYVGYVYACVPLFHRQQY